MGWSRLSMYSLFTHDGLTDENSGEIAACSADDPCTDFHQANPTNNIDMDLADTNNSGLSDACSESPGLNDFQCACDTGHYGETCESDWPCGADDTISNVTRTSVCYGAKGENDTMNNVCDCEDSCASHSENA